MEKYKKVLVVIVVAIVIGISCFIGVNRMAGASAMFTDKSEISNSISAGNVKIEISGGDSSNYPFNGNVTYGG